MQHPDADQTTWNITFGTYGTRLHGSNRPTVDRKHNRFGEPFMDQDSPRENLERQRMTAGSVILTRLQRIFIELSLPTICDRGGWTLRTCAAGPDHIHVLCDVVHSVHGKQVRKLLKRWLTQALDEKWPRASDWPWWADGGSNKAVKDDSYVCNAHKYILKQRATASSERDRPRTS